MLAEALHRDDARRRCRRRDAGGPQRRGPPARRGPPRRPGRRRARARRRRGPRRRARRAAASPRALLRATPPRGVQVWVVRDLNPDGSRPRHAAERARRRPQPQLPPPLARAARAGATARAARAASEPETRWAMRLDPRDPAARHGLAAPAVRVRRAEPRAPSRASCAATRRPRGCPSAACRATAGRPPGWENRAAARRRRVRRRAARRAAPSRATIRRHVRAVWAAARSRRRRRRAAQEADRPPIHWDPIPFGLKRKRQMRRYARRHYGTETHLLEGAEDDRRALHRGRHATRRRATTFAANRPDLGELPGTCSHFVIDKRGHDPPARLAEVHVPPRRSASTTSPTGSSTSGAATRRSWATAASSTPRCA